MPNRPSALSTPATVYFWTSKSPNRRFATLAQALDHCRKHVDQLPAIEVFIHSGQIPEPILSSDELAHLVAIGKAQ